jgi:putative ABC transport system substrate-binding protein
MRRREFISLLGGTAASWPLAARAQQRAMPVVGHLYGETANALVMQTRAFEQGLSQSGFVDGHNVIIDYQWAEGDYGRLPALAAGLLRRRVAVIVTAGGPATLAAKAATVTVPIVFLVGLDPVAGGLVASLNRPGGNLTGVVSLGVEVGPKLVELLHELIPTRALAVLVNPTGASAEAQLTGAQTAARTLGLQLHVLHASTEGDLGVVFTRLPQLQAGALVITPNTFFYAQREQLATLALRHAVPAIFPWREAVTAGGLMSYGTDLRDQHRIIGTYTGRILKGERPADLPVQQATKIELTINMKTAKALGLTFPITLLGRADEVIE